MADAPVEREQTALPPDRVSELAEGGAQVVDVRTPSEHEAGHVPGDLHLVLETLTEEAATLDRTRPVVFYCRSGERSGAAADAFRESGWEAYSMDGGLLAWAERDMPLEPEGGEVAARPNLPGF